MPQRKITLVHVTTVPITLGFFRGQIGYLKANGFAIQAVSSPGSQALEFAQREGIQVHAVPMTRAIAPIHDVVALYRLWRLFRAIRPDVVHSHTPKAGLLGTLVARATGVPVVFLSVFGLAQMTKSGLTRTILDASTRVACGLAHRVWCDSFSMRDYLVKERLCSPSKVIVLGQGSVNGVDAEGKFSPSSYPPELRVSTRSQYGIPAEATVLGFVGRIVRDKGMHELAEAWRTLSSHYPDIHLLLVGPFESKDMLLPNDQALFSTHPRIHLAGWRTDIPAHFAAMDIFVMPSYREGFGVTNIEAAAMELPVVSTRIPGCVDSIQDGVTGILVPAHDAVALAGAMRTYIDHPELRLQHGQAGRVRVLRDFRPEMVWDGLLREYQGQLKNRARTVSSLST